MDDYKPVSDYIHRLHSTIFYMCDHTDKHNTQLGDRSFAAAAQKSGTPCYELEMTTNVSRDYSRHLLD